MLKGRNGLGGLFAGVDQFFTQRTNNAIVTGIDLTNVLFMLAGGLNDAAGGCIDNSGDAAGLRIESVFLGLQ